MAHGEPISFLEFQERFSDEDACYNYLFKVRWPDGFVCPRCGNKEYYLVSRRRLYQCRSCNHQASVTAGTIFHKTRTPLRKWFLAIYLVATDKRGLSGLSLKGHIGVSYPTAWLMLHKIRAAMSHRDGKYKLSGLIQLDEAFFGGPSGKKGRGTEKATAYVAVSTAENGKPLYAKALVVDGINKGTALEFATSYLLPGCTVSTDGLNIYPQLKEQGYAHERVLSSSKEAETALHWVHTLVSNAKAFISGTYHGLDHKHLQAYLDEYLYRFNRRRWQPELFARLLTACTTGPIVTYADLTG